jgi:hypothetical protein
MFYGIEERYLVIKNKVVIVCRAVRCDIAMEIPDCPVDRANPENAGFYFSGFHETSYIELML